MIPRFNIKAIEQQIQYESYLDPIFFDPPMRMRFIGNGDIFYGDKKLDYYLIRMAVVGWYKLHRKPLVIIIKKKDWEDIDFQDGLITFVNEPKTDRVDFQFNVKEYQPSLRLSQLLMKEMERRKQEGLGGGSFKIPSSYIKWNAPSAVASWGAELYITYREKR